MVTQSEVHSWAEGLEAVVGRIAPRFGRAEPRRRTAVYRRGLLAPVERKSGWPRRWVTACRMGCRTS